MLELLVVLVRALALACRGHRELVLENLAPAAAVDGHATHDQASQSPDARPPVLDRLGAKLAELAYGIGARAAGHCRALASRLASPSMDPTLETSARRPSTDRSADPRPRSRHGVRKSVVGSAADSR